MIHPDAAPESGSIIASPAMSRRGFLGVATVAAAVLPGLGHATATDDQVLARFGVLTDVQYADADPTAERDYRASLPKLRESVAALAKEKLAFTLHLGDLIDRKWESFDPVLRELQELGHPVRHVLGNHDFDVGAEHLDAVAKRLGLDSRGYGSFRHGGVCWVILDTNEISTYRHAPGSKSAVRAEEVLRELQHTRAANAKPWNGGVSPAQLAWLDEQLTESAARHEPVIVCGHHPLISESGHQAWNAPAILEVLGKHPNARAYLCGHQHPGGLSIAPNGMPMITFRSVLGPPGVNAWSVVTLTRTHLRIAAHGREISRILPLPG